MSIRRAFDRWRGNIGPWTLAAQVLVGLFFLAAAAHKVSMYFVDGRSIADDFAYWESLGYPPQWYRAFLHALFALPYGHRVLEIAVIALQGVGGALLVLNRGTRIGGWLLLFVQANVFLGTFHHLGFNEFVGVSLAIALYFALRPSDGRWTGAGWRAIVWPVAAVTALFLYNRWVMGDPWIANVEWRRLDLQQDVMSTAWFWKSSALAIAASPIGPYAWVAPWWIGLALVPPLFSRRARPYALAGLLVLATLRTLTWMNSITSQGVLFVLLYFLVLADERERTR